MLDWTDEHAQMRDAVRDFVDRNVAPLREELEHGDLPPYDVLRSYVRTFGIDELALERLDRETSSGPPFTNEERYERAVLTLMPMIEFCRHCPGLVTAMGVSMNLAGNAIKRGTPDQRERWAKDLLTLNKVGAWAITEPDSGSDAFGGMRSTAVRDGDEFVLNGAKTFITNGPFADTTVFICKLDDGVTAPRERRVLSFVLDRGMPGFEQTPPLRKMGLHSSPTGQLFLSDVARRHRPSDRRRGRPSASREKSILDQPDRGDARAAARATFASERASIAAMALGIIEQCLDVVRRLRPHSGSVRTHDRRVPADPVEARRDGGRSRERAQHAVPVPRDHRAGETLSFAEASAIKLYSARAATEVALDAVQVLGGNGYMTEFHVEQLARDAKVLQIYAGTDELQITAIAKDLLRGD